MTTAARRAIKKGRAPRWDGSYVTRTHVPHVAGQRCPQCRPAGRTMDQRVLMGESGKVPFRRPDVRIEQLLAREKSTPGSFTLAENLRAIFDAGVHAGFGGAVRRAQRGRGPRVRAGK